MSEAVSHSLAVMAGVIICPPPISIYDWWLLTGGKLIDLEVIFVGIYSFISTVNIFVVSGLRVREPPEVTTT